MDVVCWLVEPTTFIGENEQHIIKRLKAVKSPIILVINKIDTIQKEEILPVIEKYRKEIDFVEIVPVSAKSGKNVDELIDTILKY